MHFYFNILSHNDFMFVIKKTCWLNEVLIEFSDWELNGKPQRYLNWINFGCNDFYLESMWTKNKLYYQKMAISVFKWLVLPFLIRVGINFGLGADFWMSLPEGIYYIDGNYPVVTAWKGCFVNNDLLH